MIATPRVLTFAETQIIRYLLDEVHIWAVHGFKLSHPSGWSIEVVTEFLGEPKAFLEIIVKQYGHVVHLPVPMVPRLLRDAHGRTMESVIREGLMFYPDSPTWYGQWYRISIWD